MSKKRERNKDTNIILYPGLVKRLIEKGMDALKQKEASAAYDYFVSAEVHEPDNPQVRFGKVLSLVDLGKLREAVELTSALLREGIGDYYDNLQVHISLLVQLGYYQEVVDMLDAVIAENRIPAQFAESFYQLLHFSRQMIDDNALLENIEIQPDPLNDGAIRLLKSPSSQKQWMGIQQLKKSRHPEAINSLITYIEDNKNDSLLRSIALIALHKNDVKIPVRLEKFGQCKKIVPNKLEELYEVEFGKHVNQVLSQQLEHEDPMLLDVSKQICWTHLYILYPFLPSPTDVQLWAGVFHLAASERLSIEEDEETIASKYNCSSKLLIEKMNEVVEIEGQVFQAFDFELLVDE